MGKSNESLARQILSNVRVYGQIDSICGLLVFISAFGLCVITGVWRRSESLLESAFVYFAMLIITLMICILSIGFIRLVKDIVDGYKAIKISILYTKTPRSMEEALDSNINTADKYLECIKDVFGKAKKLLSIHLENIVEITYDMMIHQITTNGADSIFGKYFKDIDINKLYNDEQKLFNSVIEIGIINYIKVMHKSNENLAEFTSKYISGYLDNDLSVEDKTKLINERLLDTRHYTFN